MTKKTKTYIKLLKDYMWILVLAAIMIIFGICVSGFEETFKGFVQILFTNDSLFTDFFVQGSIGGAFLNAGLVEIIGVIICILSKKEIDGNITAALFFFMGFSLFGKDCLNIWPIILGVFLNSKMHKQPFKDKLVVTFLGCTMAPVVSEFLFYEGYSLVIGITLALLVGTLTGFILPNVARIVFKFHQGYNIYNTGFAGGIILTVVASFMKVFGFEVDKKMLWYTENNSFLLYFLLFFFAYLVIYGIASGLGKKEDAGQNLIKIFYAEGKAPCDYWKTYGKSAAVANMGILGMIAVIFVSAVGADLNGVTIGAIMAIVGYGAAGKNIRGVCYIFIGALIGALCGFWDITAPGIIVGTLFATGLAPIAEKGGIFFGMLAAMMHLAVVQNTSGLHYGLNLYNNGFSCGIVACFIRALAYVLKLDKIEDPLITLINKIKSKHKYETGGE